MKIFMLVIDGVSDDPISELRGATPLEVADTPFIEYLAQTAEIGTIQTAFPGYPVESLICIMGLLGYPPHKYYPSGRSSFEAMARGIALNASDLVLRCNIIQAKEGPSAISDFTSGMISDTYAKKIISRLILPRPTWELYPGQSYRNLLVIRDASVSAEEIKLFEPHMHQNMPLKEILPLATVDKAESFAQTLRYFLLDSYKQISAMNLSKDCKGNMLWFWSPSSKPDMPSFEKLQGISGAVVAGLDFMHGLAMATDMYFEIIPGATGYIDTDYNAKAQATIDFLDKYDFVLTHVNAADEAAHAHNLMQKIDAIEKIDGLILGPVFNHLKRVHADNFTIIICGDHKTRSIDGKHVGDKVPFLCYKRMLNNFSWRTKKWTDSPQGKEYQSLDIVRRSVNSAIKHI